MERIDPRDPLPGYGSEPTSRWATPYLEQRPDGTVKHVCALRLGQLLTAAEIAAGAKPVVKAESADALQALMDEQDQIVYRVRYGPTGGAAGSSAGP